MVTAAAPQAVAVSDAFRSPTGNIVCMYQGPGGYEPVTLVCQTLNDGYTVTLRPTGPARGISQPRISGSGFPVLRYNRQWARRPYTCRVTRQGLRCFSTRSRHGFFLSRTAFSRLRA
jgi:hypothetical protein